MKRQEDEGDADPSIEELCHDRPADEYFRLNTNGDCRDVVRYVHRPLEYSCSPATVDRSVSGQAAAAGALEARMKIICNYPAKEP